MVCNDIRQYVLDTRALVNYTCFHLKTDTEVCLTNNIARIVTIYSKIKISNNLYIIIQVLYKRYLMLHAMICKGYLMSAYNVYCLNNK